MKVLIFQKKILIVFCSRSEWSEDKCTLSLLPAQPTDAGTWTCLTDDVVQKKHDSFTLEVVSGELEVAIEEDPFEDMKIETDLEEEYELR